MKKVKGIDILGVVQELRAWRKKHGKEPPNVDPRDIRLLSTERIVVTDWYDIEAWFRLLDVLHKTIYGGTPEGAREMGRISAMRVYTTMYAGLLWPGDIPRTLAGFSSLSRVHHDAGHWVLDHIDANTALLRIGDYENMTELHGVLLEGWFDVIIRLAGGTPERVEILGAPWQGQAEYVLKLTWREP